MVGLAAVPSFPRKSDPYLDQVVDGAPVIVDGEGRRDDDLAAIRVRVGAGDRVQQTTFWSGVKVWIQMGSEIAGGESGFVTGA